MRYPLVRELAVDGVPVTVTCRMLLFSIQAFYQWRRNPVSQRDWDDAHLTNIAWDAHRDDPALGYRFISGIEDSDGKNVAPSAFRPLGSRIFDVQSAVVVLLDESDLSGDLCSIIATDPG